jgi:hypothetical protein
MDCHLFKTHYPWAVEKVEHGTQREENTENNFFTDPKKAIL